MVRKVLVQDDAEVPVQQFQTNSRIENADNSVFADAGATSLSISAFGAESANIVVDGAGTVLIAGAGNTTIMLNADDTMTLGADGLVTVNDNTFAEDSTASLAGGVGVFNPDGSVDIGPGKVTVSPAGTITLGPAITIVADTSISIGTGAILLPFLPTADPVAAGQLWNDGGTLKVSAG